MQPLPPTSPGKLPEPQWQAKRSSLPSAVDSPAHVLVVEDNSQMAQMIASALETNYRVTTARDGQEGLEQALALRPNVILCDVLMPRMGGEQLVRMLRARPDFDDIPIVVLSGRTDQQLRIQLLRAGAQDYLEKPFHYEELRVRIANLLTIQHVRQILQWELTSQSQDLATLATEVTSRQQEIMQAHSLLQQRETLLQEQADQLEKRNRELEYLSEKRDQAEETIHRLASIVESSGEAIYSKTLEGVITSWNNSAEHLYGYAAGEVMGNYVSLIIPPDNQKELEEIIERIKAGETLENYETRRMRKDGTLIDVSETLSPIRNARGRIVGASTLAHDITEQKQMVKELAIKELAIRNSELERMNQELRQQHNKLREVNLALEEANQVRSQFLATMSHELRTPLASIVGFGEMLLEDVRADGWSQQQRSNLESILNNGEHLLDLINDVLDLSKIDAGRMVLGYSQVNLNALLLAVADEIGSLATKRNLFLNTEVEEGVVSLETNAGKLHQILLNLVSNALKFTEQGGVTLSANRVLLSDQTTEGIALAVRDSGIGIAPAVQKLIFDAFYQADMSYTRKVGGTGLGLAIARQMTVLLGGTISVKSALGQGSTFTVILPLKAGSTFIGQEIPRLHPGQAQTPSTLPPAARELVSTRSHAILEGSGQAERMAGQSNLILAVDDNQESLALIQNAMRGTPYTILEVHDPLTVMQLAQERRPCAITLDVMMPDLNGWQLLHQLKDNPATASIPVVMLTVLSDKMTGYVLGADEYLIKPYQKEVLRNTLQRVIDAKEDLFEAGKQETQPME